MSKDVFILGGKRTAMGEYAGALKDISAIDLAAIAARGALEANRRRARRNRSHCHWYRCRPVSGAIS